MRRQPVVYPLAMPEHDPLVELLDEGRASAGQAGRARERALRQAAEEEASLAGTLVDLAERRSRVVVRTETGRAHAGVVESVGGDYCVVRSDAGAAAHLRLEAIATVRPAPGERHVPASGDRRAAADVLLLEALGRVAHQRPQVALVTRGGDVVVGTLRAAGADVVTVWSGTGPGTEGPCYVAAGAITEVVLDP
jgi:hypothetical protein